MNTDASILLLLADLQRDKAMLLQRVAQLEAELEAASEQASHDATQA